MKPQKLWYAREKGSAEWHGGWETRFDAVRGIASMLGTDPVPVDVVEAHYEFVKSADIQNDLIDIRLAALSRWLGSGKGDAAYRLTVRALAARGITYREDLRYA